MDFLKLYLFLLCAGLNSLLFAMARIENINDYNFGRVHPGELPARESTLLISMTNYTVTISGHHDQNNHFNLANGIYLVPYSISWKDNSGNLIPVLPNTVSPVFGGIANNNANPMLMAILRMQIQAYAPRPGHYSDTLTLVINPV